MTATTPAAPSIDPAEVAHFERLAHRWWDPAGPFWPLHRLNALRTTWLRERLARAFDRDPGAERPLAGLRLLDIGCGGGILSESMARLGAEVTGIDVVEKNLRVARLHAGRGGLAIDYRHAAAEDLVAAGETFDAVLNMEVVEHVERRPEFLRACADLVRPGGLMAVATINRNPLAFLIAIVGAEYVLGWLPKGTHHYRKLVRPEEVLDGLGPDLSLLDETGVRVNPFDRSLHFTRFRGVNYMMLLRKAAG
jgi:2-polyprenyl-6-hydroxyphenyl methylase/3-demethylubiquinone-9 3-methyltransferase